MNIEEQSFDSELLAQNLSNAREACGKSLKEVSDLIGIPSSRLRNYEKGKYIPSLPELESISYIYRIPIFALTGKGELGSYIHAPNSDHFQNLVKIRREVISTRLQLAIEGMETSYKELSDKTGITYGSIKRFEEGDSEPSVDDLRKLANALGINFSEFEDKDSPIGSWQKTQSINKKIKLIPDDLINFFINPENIKHLLIAQSISEIGVESLSKLHDSMSDLLEEISKD